MLKKLWLVVALFVIFSLQGSVAQAQEVTTDNAGSTLSNIPIRIDDVSVFQGGDQLRFSAALRNESTRDIVVRSGAEFYLSKESLVSKVVYVEGAPDVLTIPAGQTVKQEFSVLTPNLPTGQYRVYMGVAEDKSTRLGAKKFIATLELGVEHSAILTDCKMEEQSLTDGILEVSPQNARLSGVITCQGALTSGEGQVGQVLVHLQDRQYVTGTELAKAEVNFTSQVQSIALPFDVEAEPGSYDIEVLPIDTEGRAMGAAVRTRLVMAGLGGKIVSFSNLKDNYEAGAKVTIEALTRRFSDAAATLQIELSSDGKSCAELLVIPVTRDLVTGTATMTNACDHPTALVTLAASDGAVLDTLNQKKAVLPSTGESAPVKTFLTQRDKQLNWWMIFWLLPVVVLVSWLAVRRVRRAGAAGVKTLMYLLFFFGASLGVTNQAHAGTANFAFWEICSGPCGNASAIFANMSTNKDTYAPGESITVDVVLSSDDFPVAPICPMLRLGINGSGYTSDLVPDCYTAQQVRSGLQATFTVVNAPGTAGAFSLSVSAGISGYAGPAPKNIPLTVSVPAPAPTVTLNPFSPSTITAGQTSSISFSSTDTTSCTGSGIWNGNVGTSNLGISTGAMSAGTYTQQVTCTGPGGAASSVTRTLQVNPAPVASASFTSTPPCVIAANQSGCNTTLVYTASNVTGAVLTNCSSDGNPGQPDAVLNSIVAGPGFASVWVPYNSGCYRIHNNNNTGPVLAQTTANSSCIAGTSWPPLGTACVAAAAPSVIITATGPVAYEPKSLWQKAISFLIGRDHPAQASGLEAIITVGENARINWNSSNVSSCNITSSDGFFQTVTPNAAGNLRITGLTNIPQSTHVYTITCQQAGFSDVTDSVTIRVNPTRADGVCATSQNNCVSGIPRDDTDTPTQYLWTCMGVGGGTNSPQCSETIPGGGGPSTPNLATFTAIPGACGTGTINLDWADVSGATSYQVRDGASQIYDGAASAFSHTGLLGLSSHSYTVRATNSSGSSSWSSARAATAPSSCASTSTITASAGPGGFISPSGSVSVAAGASQRFDMTESFPYVVSNVVVDGLSVGPVQSYTFSNVVSNHTISVSFVASGASGITQATSCVINSGQSTCTGRLSWNSPGANPYISVNGTTFESFANSATNQAVTLDFGDHRVTRRDDDGMDYATMSAICTGSLYYTAGICQVNGGIITASSRCYIPEGQSTCDVNVNWTTRGATAPNVYNVTRGVTYSNAPSGIDQPFPITFGYNTIRLRNNTTTWDSVRPRGYCLAPGVWNPTAGICQSPSTPCAADVAKSWTVSGTTCDGVTPDTNSSQNGTVDDVTEPTTGSAQYLCTNGIWAASPQAGATCAPSPARLDVCPVSTTVQEGTTQSFTAFHTLQGVAFDGCSGSSVRSNVTASTTWGTTNAGVVTISGGTATGQAVGSASITASYIALNAPNVPVTVIAACSPNLCTDDARSGTICVGDTFTIDDGCGNPNLQCNGTRVCDYNWKEVAP